ncbi:MAG: GNAT family N-acetyltransferase [Chloroflexales bacterium]|nr:GNAT family N-acetyltransferase [Chloroflexales bacterium]
MQYYYRLNSQETWVGPYAEGRLCIFDAAWAAQLGNTLVTALAVPNDMDPEEALAANRAIRANVPQDTLIGNINHTIYEPPSEWIMAADDGDLPTEGLKKPQRLDRLVRKPPRRNSKVAVRPAIPKDAAAILDMQRRAFTRYLTVFTAHQVNPLIETIEEVRQAVQNQDVYVVTEDDILRGSARVFIKSGVALLTNISIDPDHEQRGIGTSLLKLIENQVQGKAHKLYLETPLLAPQSLRFYVELGYEPAGILRRHYVGVDWLAFEKFLS